MKTFKFSSIALLSILFMWTFMPNLSAKTRSSFSFSLNLTPRAYVQYAQPVVPTYVTPMAPAYVTPMAPAYVVQPYSPYSPYYAERAYYVTPAPVYREVVSQRPGLGAAVHPHYSYWRY